MSIDPSLVGRERTGRVGGEKEEGLDDVVFLGTTTPNVLTNTNTTAAAAAAAAARPPEEEEYQNPHTSSRPRIDNPTRGRRGRSKKIARESFATNNNQQRIFSNSSSANLKHPPQPQPQPQPEEAENFRWEYSSSFLSPIATNNNLRRRDAAAAAHNYGSMVAVAARNENNVVDSTGNPIVDHLKAKIQSLENKYKFYRSHSKDQVFHIRRLNQEATNRFKELHYLRGERERLMTYWEDTESHEKSNREQIQSLCEENKTLKYNVQSLTRKIANTNRDLNQKVRALEDVVARLKENAKSQQDAAADELQQSKDQVTSLTQRLETAAGQLATAQGQVASLEERLGTAEGQVASLKERLGAADDQLETAEGQVASLKQRLEPAEGTLKTVSLALASALGHHNQFSGHLSTISSSILKWKEECNPDRSGCQSATSTSGRKRKASDHGDDDNGLAPRVDTADSDAMDEVADSAFPPSDADETTAFDVSPPLDQNQGAERTGGVAGDHDNNDEFSFDNVADDRGKFSIRKVVVGLEAAVDHYNATNRTNWKHEEVKKRIVEGRRCEGVKDVYDYLKNSYHTAAEQTYIVRDLVEISLRRKEGNLAYNIFRGPIIIPKQVLEEKYDLTYLEKSDKYNDSLDIDMSPWEQIVSV